jgi:hypothetical protein
LPESVLVARLPSVTRPPSLLSPEQSGSARDRLLAEVGGLSSAEAAASWAREAIATKNSLAANDAKAVEEAFGRKLSELTPAPDRGREAEEPLPPSPPEALKLDGTEAAPVPAIDSIQETGKQQAGPLSGANRATDIDNDALAIAKPRRHRSKEHLRFVAKQACIVCGRKHSDPHHLGFMQPRALGRKVSDEYVVPLCRIHHRAVHRVSDEQVWWTQQGIDPVELARNLWARTRLDGSTRGSPAKLATSEPNKGSGSNASAGGGTT